MFSHLHNQHGLIWWIPVKPTIGDLQLALCIAAKLSRCELVDVGLDWGTRHLKDERFNLNPVNLPISFYHAETRSSLSIPCRSSLSNKEHQHSSHVHSSSLIYLVPVTDGEPDGVAPLVKDEGAQRRVLVDEALGGGDGQLRRMVVFCHHVNHQL